MALDGPEMSQDLQDSRKMAKDGPRWAKMGQDSRKMAKDGSGMRQSSSKTAEKSTKTGPSCCYLYCPKMAQAAATSIAIATATAAAAFAAVDSQIWSLALLRRTTLGRSPYSEGTSTGARERISNLYKKHVNLWVPLG